MFDDLEQVELVMAESETIPSFCEVSRGPDGKIYAEIWIRDPLSCEDVWQYAITKLR